jgi:restriction system protein
MWMIRGDGGTLYEKFKERSAAGIGWIGISNLAIGGASRETLIDTYHALQPHAKTGNVISSVSQVMRFINEVAVNDWVVSYSPLNRTYILGQVKNKPIYKTEWEEDNMPLCRTVHWSDREVDRDLLSQSTKNSLGSTLTLFKLPDTVTQELLSKLNASPDKAVVHPQFSEQEVEDPLLNIESQAFERIKDIVNQLQWDEMQELVAGILRAMGYKTQVSPPGADRGKDIIASPDGFGFENPRIVVEVKHRKEKMGSQEIRSFLGGRHKDDRGLYVSTGGFSVDGQYEADRATVPLTLWTLDHLVRALVEHYDKTDSETKRLVPLKRIYWPA